MESLACACCSFKALVAAFVALAAWFCFLIHSSEPLITPAWPLWFFAIAAVASFTVLVNKVVIEAIFDVNTIKHIDFFVSHGSQDQVIPVEWARKTQPYLEKLGLQVEYKEYPVGHGVAPQNFWDFKNWLEKI